MPSNNIKLIGSPARKPARRHNRRGYTPLTPGIEALEGRILLADFVVSNTNDSGPGSLRQAILDANASPGSDIVTLSIDSTPHTIRPTSPLPAITDSVWLSPDLHAGSRLFEIDGSLAGPNACGLVIKANNCTVQNMVISHFSGDGILISDACNNTIQENSIDHNAGNGINIVEAQARSTGNRISANDIADNGQLGIRLGKNPKDERLGANNLQQAPQLTLAMLHEQGGSADTADVTVMGTLRGKRNTTYIIQFFYSRPDGPSPLPPDCHYFNGLRATTGSDGIAAFRFAEDFLPNLDVGDIITATAADPHGNTSQFSNPVIVQEQHLLSGDGRACDPQVSQGDSANNIPIAVVHDTNPSTSAADLSATIDWGDGTPPSKGTIVSSGDGKFEIRGSHTYYQSSFPGPYFAPDPYFTTIIVQHRDGQTIQINSWVTMETTLCVKGRELIANDYVPMRNTTIATFQDTLRKSTPADFTATVLWEDMTDPVPATIDLAPNGSFVVRASHTFTENVDDLSITRCYHAHVRVKHKDGRETVVTTAIGLYPSRMQLRASDFSATEGVPTGLVRVATLTDSNPKRSANNYTATVYWGNNTSSPGIMVSEGKGRFGIYGSTKYKHPGSFNIYVSVRRGYVGEMCDANCTAHVADASFVPLARPLTLIRRFPIRGPVFSFIDRNPLAQPDDYQIAIDWGDGSQSHSLSSDSPPSARRSSSARGRFDILADHAYARPGSYKVTIEIDEGPYQQKLFHIEARVH